MCVVRRQSRERVEREREKEPSIWGFLGALYSDLTLIQDSVLARLTQSNGPLEAWGDDTENGCVRVMILVDLRQG
jgi:hypothetical protein